MPKKNPSRSARAGGALRRLSAGDERDVIVYVHGIGGQSPPEALKREWDLALFGREMGDRSRMAYWADILHPPGAEAARHARTLGDSRELDVQAALREAGLDPDDPAVQAMAAALLQEVGMPVAAVPALGKRVLPLPAFLRKPISRRFLESFVGDTAAYFFRPEVRTEAQQRLHAVLPSAGERVTLVAHSQGTIISYEVLASLGADAPEVTQYVTLGSPLGIREVQDFLEPSGLKVPERVAKWNNFADPLDPVALDKRLAADFDPRGFIQDTVVLNANTRSITDFNPHSSVGYLANATVRRVVFDALRMDTMARFVIARDVAEMLASVPEARHSVLIEVLEPGYSAVDESRQETARMEREEAALLASRPAPAELPLLRDRIARAAKGLEKIVRETAPATSERGRRAEVEAARIETLRRFVAARLTPGQLMAVAASHRELRVYAVWRSARKAKLTGRSLRVLKADAALASFSAGGDGITWAVLDTGIRADHPHFRDGVVREVWDCTQPGPPRPIAEAKDPDGHGTHVAGIIAGRAPEIAGPDGNPMLERGVAPRARLVVYKVLDDRGQGEDAWIIKALDHIAEQNENASGGLAIHGLNLSLGGPFDATVYGCGFSPICMELRRLWRDGVLVVVACGNEGQIAVDTPNGEYEMYAQMSIGDPANLEDCIAVGSVNADQPHLYGVSSFSSRGPTADGRMKPDVIAPGERISSCNSRYHERGQALYFAESGTSMAAPHVSGLLAAFLSVRREFRGRPDEVKRILLDSCSDLGRDRYHQGRGVPNLMQMLLSV